jgi:hypothetical protein
MRIGYLADGHKHLARKLLYAMWVESKACPHKEVATIALL